MEALARISWSGISRCRQLRNKLSGNWLGDKAEKLVEAVTGLEKDGRLSAKEVYGLAKSRIPDFVDYANRTIIEVKNVSSFSRRYESQLLDELKIASDEGFKLVVIIAKRAEGTGQAFVDKPRGKGVNVQYWEFPTGPGVGGTTPYGPRQQDLGPGP